jgi:MFS family permease
MSRVNERRQSASAVILPTRARKAVFLAFLVNGFALSIWVVNIPAVAQAADISNAVLGTALLALGIGSVIAMQASGYLSALVGSRLAVVVGAVLLAGGLLLLIVADGAVGLGVALFVFGLGNGCIDVAQNDQAVIVERRYGRPIMSAFHALFSVGGAVGAAAGAAVQALGVSYKTTFAVAAVIVVIAGSLAALGLLDREQSHATSVSADEAEGKAVSAEPRSLLRKAIILGVLAFAFMLAEGMVNDWSAVHARQHLGESASSASLAYFFFAVTMTSGRLVVDRVVERIGAVRVVRWGSATAVVGLGIVVASPTYQMTIIGWIVFGIGLAGVVPQLFTAAGALAPGRRGAIMLSRIVSGGYVGMLAGPAVIGWVSEWTGINIALLVPLVLLVIGFVAAPVVRRDGAEKEPV